jgi:hypothetical protein
LLQEEVDSVGGEIPLGVSFSVEGAQQITGGLSPGGITVNGENITPVANFDIESLLYLAQVLVELTAQAGETAGIIGFEGDGQCVDAGIQVGVIPLLAVVAFWQSIATLCVR